jgi:cytochrome P450
MRYDPLNPEVKQNPYPSYEVLRREEPVCWIDSMQAFAVARYDDVKDVLLNPKEYSSEAFWDALLGEYNPVPTVKWMITTDPPNHLRLRKLANKAFLPKHLLGLTERIQTLAHEILDHAVGRGEDAFDFVWDFAALFPVSVVADLLGVDLERRLEFKHWVDDLLGASNRTSFTQEQKERTRRSVEALRDYFIELIARRRKTPGSDLISGFVQAEEDGQRLREDEILAMGILLLIGGTETTTNLLGNTLILLHERPDVYDTVKREPSLIPDLIDEVLRFNTPVQLLFRNTVREVELAGVKISAGALVLPLLGSANRDETKYPNPNVFDVQRKPKEILSFGAGPHFCIGAQLSRLEAKLALEILLQRFERLILQEPTVTWIDSYILRGPQKLPVWFEATSAAPKRTDSTRRSEA